MEISVHTVGFKSETLENLVKTSIHNLDEFNNQIIRVGVTLYEDKCLKFENQFCVIQLFLPGNVVYAKENTTDFEKSISKSIESVQKLLHKSKKVLLFNW
jgi:ribosome-associated translation inhibitor RaiA